MTDIASAELNQEPSPRFAKRRKVYRQRPTEEDHDDLLTASERPSDTSQSAPNGVPQDLTEEDNASIADIIRSRKQARGRRQGIQFTDSAANQTRNGSGTPQVGELIVRDDTVEEPPTVVNRFAPQTGQVADVNKHMMAFIDAELAKRLDVPSGQPSNPEDPSSRSSGGGLRARTLVEANLSRQPAALGKLHEIDLGPDATLRNIALTEAAQRRLRGEDGGSESETPPPVRLGRDGKPLRERRGRKRRTSDDIRRDKLVEEVLRESKLDVYDPHHPLQNAYSPHHPSNHPDDEGEDDDGTTADDRIAEQFRREFLDAVSSRQRRKPGPPPSSGGSGPGAKKGEEKPKGPKLGGSRSARAAMREILEKGGKK
ncbi:MAG: hypothetical protein M1817_002159 [Caeruleum heppii]|nr:MAG: hypothetical protein M1817_002159 [Caeruleum heppii]